jgi:ribosomal protein S19E (S16A)
MEPPTLSPSEKLTLKHLAEGELHARELDWVALQRLKRLGLVEERSTGPALTKEGRRELQRLLARA